MMVQDSSWGLVSAAQQMTVTNNSLTTSEDLYRVLARMLNAMDTTSGVGMSVDVAESVGAAQAAVKLISNTMASSPIGLYQTGQKRQVLIDNPLYSLIQVRPNEYYNSFQWRAMMQRDLEWRGNAYSLKVRGVGQRIVELIRLHPDMVNVQLDSQGRPDYTYTRQDGRQFKFKRDDLMHLWWWSDDGFKGKSTIQDHRDSFGEAVALRRHSAKFFANGARPAGVIFQPPGLKVSDESLGNLRTDFEKLYSGTENAWRTIFLPAGLDYKPVSMSNVDSDYIESAKMSIREIARIFGLPPHKIGDLERATFTNIEHQSIEYHNDAIVPRKTLWENVLFTDILEGDDTYYFKIDTSHVLQGDFKSRQDGKQIQRRNGIINANEWRESEGMDPRDDAGGDQYIFEKNMINNDGTVPADQQVEQNNV